MNDPIPEGRMVYKPVNFAEVNLGNILYHIGIQSLVEVVGKAENDTAHVVSLSDKSEYHTPRSNLVPALLSEELMNSFEFERSIHFNGLKFVKGKMILLTGVGWEKDFKLVTDESKGLNEATITINFAHDLQNLYSKVEGKYLKIK